MIYDFSDVRTRRFKNLQFTPNVEEKIDIPRDFALKKMQLLLRGRLAVAGGTASGVFVYGGALNLLQQIQISGVNSAGLESVPKKGRGKYFHTADWIFSGTRPVHSGIADGGNADIGNYDFEEVINLYMYPYAMPDEVSDLCLLYAPLYSSLELLVQWGSTASLVNGGDRTLTLTSYGLTTGLPTLEILGEQVINAYPPSIRGYFKENEITQSLSSITDSNFKIPLSTGNRHRNILLYSHINATTLMPSSTLIDKIDIEKSNTPLRQQTYNRLQKKLKDVYSLESIPAGYLMYDFSEKGTVQEFLNTEEYPVEGASLDLNVGVSPVENGALHILEGIFVIL